MLRASRSPAGLIALRRAECRISVLSDLSRKARQAEPRYNNANASDRSDSRLVD